MVRRVKTCLCLKTKNETWIENKKAIHLHLQQKGRGTCEGEKHVNNKVIELMNKRITIGSWTRTQTRSPWRGIKSQSPPWKGMGVLQE